MTTPAETARDLVVSYCFPPYVDTAAIIAAKRVREAGRPVDVIQNEMSELRPQDESLALIADHLVVRRHEVPTPSRFGTWGAVVPWVEQGLDQALAWDRTGPGYKRLYSRAQFSASHILAARIKLARPDLRWTAEFSDPLSTDVAGDLRYHAVRRDPLLTLLGAGLQRAGWPPPENGNLFSWAEELPFGLADEILFTNEHQREQMLEAVADPDLRDSVRQRSTIAPHPTLGPEFYALADPELTLEPGRRHIGYFGNFYATRGMDTVLDALALLPREQRDRLQLHLFAGAHDKLIPLVKKRGLADVVQVRPFVGFLDFLALTRRMDVLLVNDAISTASHTRNPFLPSKWSDYKGSGTPVWGIVEPGSTLSGQDLAHRSPVAHVSAAVQVLARIADEAGRR
ncbi:hypothetical protein ACQBAT_15715 [Ornithinimicrobium sp. Y1847]|uniref:hypothetical protein n=1 Tax=Ornithinimicrobium sp. Y1847 TaxID=3405419 RepID=UPI003B67325C